MPAPAAKIVRKSAIDGAPVLRCIARGRARHPIRMCGRYFIEEDDPLIAEMLARIASGPENARLAECKRGEVFPTNVVPALADGPRLMQWGFARYNGGGKVINARSETAMEKSMFSKAMRERRCLLPASWYYEWQRVGNAKKQKHEIFLPEGGPLMMAGVFRQERGLSLPVFVILTREAAPGVAHLHDRMPVILSGGAQREWLSSHCDIPAVLESAVQNLTCVPARPTA